MRRRHGFTYLELLAGIMIMTIALTPILRMMPVGMMMTRRVELLTRANFLAMAKIDELREKNFSRNPALGFSRNYREPVPPAKPPPFPSPDEKFKFTVSDTFESGTGSKVKIISVTVWFDENGNHNIDTYSSAYREDEVNVALDTKFSQR